MIVTVPVLFLSVARDGATKEKIENGRGMLILTCFSLGWAQSEVIFLGQLRHPNLVKLVGYCCEDEHRLLVYEYMEHGSLENHLFNNREYTLPSLTNCYSCFF